MLHNAIFTLLKTINSTSPAGSFIVFIVSTDHHVFLISVRNTKDWDAVNVSSDHTNTICPTPTNIPSWSTHAPNYNLAHLFISLMLSRKPAQVKFNGRKHNCKRNMLKCFTCVLEHALENQKRPIEHQTFRFVCSYTVTIWLLHSFQFVPARVVTVP